MAYSAHRSGVLFLLAAGLLLVWMAGCGRQFSFEAEKSVSSRSDEGGGESADEGGTTGGTASEGLAEGGEEYGGETGAAAPTSGRATALKPAAPLSAPGSSPEPYYMADDADYDPGAAPPPPPLAAPEMEMPAEMPGAEPRDLDFPGRYRDDFNTEAYNRIYENPFLLVRQRPLSTFSIDVDTASYSNMRRFITQGSLPPAGAVRIEEMVNYFDYDYSPPSDVEPFSAAVEIAPCPWQSDHLLARIGIKGRVIEEGQREPANLVFLLDVSGSMSDANKLPLVRTAMKMLVENLTDRDYVSIVVYAGASGLHLPPTSCETKEPILAAIDRLEAGGSTNAGEGIQLAYLVAQEHFAPEKVNRVILCTDGDFNIGITNQAELVRLIEEKARTGVFLTALGFGMGNYKDSNLEKLADKGNGNYGYIDTIHEARRILVDQLSGTLVTIAKDVKIQVDFNPAHVGAYRLIGYENRVLRDEDFHDDTKDAGEIGAGHTVTALYELVPAGKEEELNLPQVDPSKYQQPAPTDEAVAGNEVLTLKIRYKLPNEDTSSLLEFPIEMPEEVGNLSGDYQFAAAVAAFGMILRNSEYRGDAGYDLVLELARAGKGEDPNGYRGEFIQLVETARSLGSR